MKGPFKRSWYTKGRKRLLLLLLLLALFGQWTGPNELAGRLFGAWLFTVLIAYAVHFAGIGFERSYGYLRNQTGRTS